MIDEIERNLRVEAKLQGLKRETKGVSLVCNLERYDTYI